MSAKEKNTKEKTAKETKDASKGKAPKEVKVTVQAAKDTGKEKRREKRREIRWPVHARNSKLMLLGIGACNISSSGVFLRPSEDAQLPTVGDPLILTLFPRPLGQGFSTAGTVKWVGHSKEHGYNGIGIQFNDPEEITQLMKSVEDFEDFT